MNSTIMPRSTAPSKSTIVGGIKKKLITADKDTAMSAEEYENLLKKNAKPVEEIEILKKL